MRCLSTGVKKIQKKTIYGLYKYTYKIYIFLFCFGFVLTFRGLGYQPHSGMKAYLRVKHAISL